MGSFYLRRHGAKYMRYILTFFHHAETFHRLPTTPEVNVEKHCRFHIVTHLIFDILYLELGVANQRTISTHMKMKNELK